MRRSDAFWGSMLVTGGVLLLAIPNVISREFLDPIVPVTFGLGIMMLGISLAVKRLWQQIVAAVVAGVCLGTTAAYVFDCGCEPESRLLYSCSAHMWEDVDTTNDSDTIIVEPGADKKQVYPDTTFTKPVY